MSGTPANVHVWDNSDVYVSFTDAANPADTDEDFGAGWDLIGVLPDGSQFTEKVDEDSGDINSWNAGRLRRWYKNATLSVEFEAWEDNEFVRRILNREEVADDVLVIPHGPPERVKVAFVVIDGDTEHRRIYDVAEIVRNGDVEYGSEDPTMYPMIAHIFGDNDFVAGEFQSTALTGS